MDGIVEEYGVPLKQPDDCDNVKWAAEVREEISRNGIVKPTGYNVSFHINPNVEKHHFGRSHPMKPWRLTLAKSLIMSYGMHAAMDTYSSRKATQEELEDFHTHDYLEYLKTAKVGLPDGLDDKPYNLGSYDCPVFDGLFNYCSMYSGASIDAARKLCSGESDIAINWSGGLHHAKKSGASGFCYVNDIVLAILQLLRKHPRVLYIDIDVHHGDGVEEAFWSTSRVMTVSFHKYDPINFFPGSGSLDDTGPPDESNEGAHHAINVPLLDGIDDEQYLSVFKQVISKCVEKFRPSSIVLQCGADSLAGDRIGTFNVLIEGHGACVEYVKSLNIPLMLVGGGGYTPRHVARAWTNETSIAIGAKLHQDIPLHTPYLSHFRDQPLYPDLTELLSAKGQNGARRNHNTDKRIIEIVSSIHEQLRFVEQAPSVQFQQIPPDLTAWKQDVEDEIRERAEQEESYRLQREDGLGVPGEYA
ncbi:histone deacetylase domain-containing protein [Sclerotinia borealis F-4128]|uniref:Histone deacetylase n=1 Tax=Sclerotinia borealis (strain F-4128) TaxID=1432307 RepID=W9C6J8_SCLBF|nr:histone deacetylase domain-containing protein [Sclerotinia borealis F-4128]